MADPRIAKLAQVIVNYSLKLQPGESLYLSTSPFANELNLAIYKEATLAGAHIFPHSSIPGAQELFYKHATDKQLEYISPVLRTILDESDAYLNIGADHNTRELSGVDPARQGIVRKAQAESEVGTAQFGTITHAHNLEDLFESIGHTDHHIVKQSTGQSVQRSMVALISWAIDHQLAIF